MSKQEKEVALMLIQNLIIHLNRLAKDALGGQETSINQEDIIPSDIPGSTTCQTSSDDDFYMV